MIPLKNHLPFFTKFGEIFSAVTSGVLGRRVSCGPAGAELVPREKLVERLKQEGVIISTTIREPKPGIIVLYFTKDLGFMLPELLVNPSAITVPKQFTDLHRSAMEELSAQIWTAAGPLFANQLHAKFAPSGAEVRVVAFCSFLDDLPAFTDIREYVLVLAKVAVEGAVSGVMGQIYPASFWAPQPQKPPALEKDVPVALDQMPIEHVSAAPAKRRRATPTAPRTVSPSLASAFRQRNIAALMDIPIEMVAEVGRKEVSVGDVLNMAPNMVIELNREAWEPVDILVGGRPVARGEVVIIGKNSFGIRITQILTPQDRLFQKS